MKKIFLALVLAVTAVSSLQAAEKSVNWGEKIALYLPNRIMDAMDTFSVNLGVGAAAEARIMVTRYFDFGAGWNGTTYKAYKSFNRQYGAGVEEGWFWSLACIGNEEYRLVDGTFLVDKYVESRRGLPMPEKRTYNFFKGPRDLWAIGGTLSFGLSGDLYIHPVEYADFILGFFFIDLREDDMSFDSLSR